MSIRKTSGAGSPARSSSPHPIPLLADLRRLILESRRQAAAAVNVSLTMLYWRVGKRIREEVGAGARGLW